MLLHLPIAILATLSPIGVSDTLPKFDIVRECNVEGGPSVDVARCSRDEAAALRQLQEAWARNMPVRTGRPARSRRRSAVSQATLSY
jgi:hypothetical protein